MILRPSTIAPCSWSLAQAACPELPRVMKPKPLETVEDYLGVHDVAVGAEEPGQRKQRGRLETWSLLERPAGRRGVGGEVGPLRAGQGGDLGEPQAAEGGGQVPFRAGELKSGVLENTSATAPARGTGWS